ncbi:unnamed protein product, partial [Pylaiella littoralis]
MLAQWCTSAVAGCFLLFLALAQELEEPYTDADKDRPKSFWDTKVQVDPCCDVIPGEPLEVTIWFRTDGNFSETDTLFVDLPRLTTGTVENMFNDGTDIGLGELEVSPSTLWLGAWEQGVFDEASPFETSRLRMVLRPDRTIDPESEEDVFMRISKRNRISAFCGWAEDWVGFRIYTNSSGFDDLAIETSPRLGDGCRGDCYERGVCDYCHEACLCHEGQGNRTVDVVSSGGWTRLDCAHYVCPSGRSWAARPETLEGGGRGSLESHALEECSGNGRRENVDAHCFWQKCDRTSAACICADGFEGDACQRNSCPSDCSGHGVCLSMHDLGRTNEALPLMDVSNIYGGGVGSDEEVAWDFESMYACVCDSSWEVGLGAGQRQQAEYFGADCSQRRCPTGDDPLTGGDDTDCEGVTAEGGFGVGQA